MHMDKIQPKQQVWLLPCMFDIDYHRFGFDRYHWEYSYFTRIHLYLISYVVRACRNAIEFNQIPCIGELIPGGRENMKLDVLLGVPKQYQNDLDLNAIRQCFPYGKVHIQCPSDGGGLLASSGKVIAEMGDMNDDMIIVCVAVTVGYWCCT